MAIQIDVEETSLPDFRSVFEKTIIPYNRIITTYQEETALWGSKFGGIPYLPKGMEYPKNNNGQPLHLLAQINFEEMPKLEFFPEKGILQFYILNSMTEGYGQDYDDPTNQNNFRVLYFSQIDKSAYEKVDLIDPDSIGNGDFPLESYPLALSFQQNTEPVSMTDCINWTKFFPEYNNYFQDCQDTKGTEDEAYFVQEFWTSGFLMTRYYFFEQFKVKKRIEAIKNQYQKVTEPHITHKIGGYAHFTQDDSRGFPNHSFDMQLLQIVSDDNISWGDSGVAHFFIKKEDLINQDFTNVLYSWDCC